MRMLSDYELLRLTFPCGCLPYTQLKTMQEWNKLGYRIKKGSKAKKIQVRLTYAFTEQGIIKEKEKEFYLYLFCKCQTYQTKNQVTQ